MDATETQRHREFLTFFSVSPWLRGQFLCASQAVDFRHGLVADGVASRSSKSSRRPSHCEEFGFLILSQDVETPLVSYGPPIGVEDEPQGNRTVTKGSPMEYMDGLNISHHQTQVSPGYSR
jgi:hypothetical protein